MHRAKNYQGNLKKNKVEGLILKYIKTLLKVKLLSRVGLFATPWTVAYQVPLSVGILQARILEWVAMLSSGRSYIYSN